MKKLFIGAAMLCAKVTDNITAHVTAIPPFPGVTPAVAELSFSIRF